MNRETFGKPRETLQEGFLCPTRVGRPYPERRTGAANSCYPLPPAGSFPPLLREGVAAE